MLLFNLEIFSDCYIHFLRISCTIYTDFKFYLMLYLHYLIYITVSDRFSRASAALYPVWLHSSLQTTIFASLETLNRWPPCPSLNTSRTTLINTLLIFWITKSNFSLIGNPVVHKPQYRLFVIFKMPQVRVLDFKRIRLAVSYSFSLWAIILTIAFDWQK